MKIGIFSDTHDNVANLEKAHQIFNNHNIELALFCGDLVSPFMFKFLSDWPWPIKMVFGNNEGDKYGIIRRLQQYDLHKIEYAPKGNIFSLEEDGQKIAVFHGNGAEITQALLTCGDYDLVCTGHDHVAKISQIGKTLWVNPGTVAGVSENPEVTKGSVAIYDTKSRQAEIIYLL
ncbi:metallophosphoesterase [Candidatus Beckwithbacteria bacterium]|nr:metallophosphoesterase [Candidatus Beckwithbacteria bacterium]